MANSLKVKLLKIESSSATQYFNDSKTSFLYSLSEPIICLPGESIIYSLVSATIPYSYYTLNKYNQYLDIQETVDNVQKPVKTYAIPAGNYDAITFAKQLSIILNVDVSIQYSITYNKVNNRFTINTTKPNTTSKFLFGTGINADTSCHSFLGCPKQDINITNQPALTGMISMSDIYHLQIKTDLGSQNVITSDSADNILEVVPITNSPLSFIYHSPYTLTKYLLSASVLYAIKVELTDNYGREVNLNGIPYIINIRIDVIKNDDYEIPTGKDYRTHESVMDQTPLQRILENPGIINKPTSSDELFKQSLKTTLNPSGFNEPPLSVQNMIEYNLIINMLKDLEKKKTKQKDKK